MEKQEDTKFVSILLRRKWAVVLVTLVALGAGVAMAVLRTPQYRAVATVVKQQTTIDQAVFGNTILRVEDPQRDLTTMANSVTTARVAQLVKADLKSSRDVADLLKQVSARSASDSNTISISATSPYPQEAADLANSFAAETIQIRKQSETQAIVQARQALESQMQEMSAAEKSSAQGVQLSTRVEQLRLLEGTQTGGYVVWQSAAAPPSPISPRPVRDTAAALVAGILFGVIFAFVIDRLDRRIRDEDGFANATALPVLAAVPRTQRWGAQKNGHHNFIGFTNGSAGLLEAYRTLRSSLQYLQVDRKLNSILVTSGLPGEGKTATTVNLALSLALSGARVVVVDADLRNPKMHTYLEIDNRNGLSTALAGSASIEDCLSAVNVKNYLPSDEMVRSQRRKAGELYRDLLCLTSGPLPPNPSELLSSDKMTSILKALSACADYVLIDSAPILVVSDAVSIAPKVDGVIIIGRANSTTTDEARQTRAVLDRIGARVVGVVAGGLKPNGTYRHKHGYYSSQEPA
jgi:polysaccharide biosynthesis transport protein